MDTTPEDQGSAHVDVAQFRARHPSRDLAGRLVCRHVDGATDATVVHPSAVALAHNMLAGAVVGFDAWAVGDEVGRMGDAGKRHAGADRALAGGRHGPVPLAPAAVEGELDVRGATTAQRGCRGHQRLFPPGHFGGGPRRGGH